MRALFPGSFDPFTRGHADVVERALALFDEVLIGVGVNVGKDGWLSAAERVERIKALYEGVGRVTVECYEGLTADFAAERGCGVIVRAVRSVKDYEYELQMADVNRRISPGIETVVLFAKPELACISSSVVRELARFSHRIDDFLPDKL